MDEQVKTSFKVTDDSSGPLAQVAKSAEKSEKALNKARQAAEKKAGPTWMQKLSEDEKSKLKSIQEQRKVDAAKKQLAGGGKGWMANLSHHEREEFSAQRDEQRLRKARSRGVKLEESKTQVTGRGAEVAALAFAGGGEGPAAKVTQFAAKAELIGTQMASFGGKIGKTGEKIAGIAGKAVALGAAFEVGYSIGEHLQEMIEKYQERQHEKENNDYAKSLGFMNAERMMEVQSLNKKIGAEESMRKRTEAAAEKLGALPTEAMGDAMVAWEHAAVAQANMIADAGAGEELGELVKMMKEAASKTVETQLLRANSEAEFNDKIKKASKELEALPIHATLEEQLAYNEALAKATAGMHLAAALVPEAMKKLKEQVEERGSYGNVLKSFAEEEDLHTKMKTLAEEQAKHMKALRPKHASNAAQFANTAEISSLSAQAAMRLKLTPEQTKEYAGELKSAAQEKSKKYYDFRGSRFDIKQQFAEGFDPDRVAVGFANDLATLGERRIMSGLSPLYAVR